MDGIRDLPAGHVYWDAEAMDIGVTKEQPQVGPTPGAQRSRMRADRLVRRARDAEPTDPAT